MSPPLSLRPLRLLLLAAAFWALPGFAQKLELGAKLPDGATQVAKHRFRVHMSMDAVLKFYAAAYPTASFPRMAIANQPNVQAVHIKNPKKGAWAGINIYETKEELRIFVVPADKPAAAPKPARPLLN